MTEHGSGTRLLAAVERIATSGQDGALLVLEADRSSLEMMSEADSDMGVAAVLLEVSSVAAGMLPSTDWARTGWNRFECVLAGKRDGLGEVARTLVERLRDHPQCGNLSWRVILTRIVPGDAARTLCCDPGYDLMRVKSPADVWIEPYVGDDWTQSQRYPVTTVLWRPDFT